MSFAEGFFNTIADGIQDRRARMRDKMDEESKLLRAEGAKRMAAVQQSRDRLTSAFNLLEGRNMDRNKIAAIAERDPGELIRLANEAAQNGLTGSDLNTAVSIAEDYELDEPIDEFISRIAPAFSDVEENPVARERNILKYMFGYNDNMDEVYNKEYMPGVSGQDIMATRGQSVFTQGNRDIDVNIDRNLLNAQPIDDRDAALINERFINNTILPELQSIRSAITSEEIKEGGTETAALAKRIDDILESDNPTEVYKLAKELGVFNKEEVRKVFEQINPQVWDRMFIGDFMSSIYDEVSDTEVPEDPPKETGTPSGTPVTSEGSTPGESATIPQETATISQEPATISEEASTVEPSEDFIVDIPRIVLPKEGEMEIEGEDGKKITVITKGSTPFAFRLDGETVRAGDEGFMELLKGFFSSYNPFYVDNPKQSEG